MALGWRARAGGAGVLVAGCIAIHAAGCGADEATSAATSTGSGGAGGAPATSHTGTGAEASGANGTGGGGGVGGAPWALEVHTELSGDAMAIRVNLPLETSACAAEPGGLPCDDLDADGIVDLWEDAALDRLRPFVVFDEDEPLIDDSSFVTAIVGRVAPAAPNVHVYMMLGYSRDYGSCGGFTSHNGDSERVALELAPLAGGGPGDYVIVAGYTAAHEGTVSDSSRLFEGAELLELVFGEDAGLGEPRWTVYASASKHGTYASIDVCEGVSVVPCFDEDCGPDGVSPGMYQRLFPYVNAGEESAPMITTLGSIGFSGDDAWADQDFCGGLGGSGCSAPVREKLLVDPFTP